MVGTGSCSMGQYRLLEVAQKPLNIVLEPLDLMVETDGAQHAARSTGIDKVGMGQGGVQRAPPCSFTGSLLCTQVAPGCWSSGVVTTLQGSEEEG